MKVFKFGGASVKDAGTLKRTAGIIQVHSSFPLLVVVSALGKTTNAMERILLLYNSGADFSEELEQLKQSHLTIMSQLFLPQHEAFNTFEKLFQSAKDSLSMEAEYDFKYDAFISYGERFSSLILSAYLKQEGLNNELIDASTHITTDDTYREAKVDWEISLEKILPLREKLKTQVLITQGFIASDKKNNTTTLGREGSDFSAAIFAYCLDAESVTIWKDVPGIMNADPKRLPAAKVFPQLPYKNASEMTYYGASVIHPKTIKPLANKKIPLFVKNFDNPDLPGTVIHDCHVEEWPPIIVFKEEQCLVSCKVTDFSFVNEFQLGKIFHVLSDLDIRINMMQNSAISFSFCIDLRENKLMKLVDKLQHDFEIFYNTGLQLVTVKNYDQQTYHEYRNRPGVMLEQSSRNTLQVLVRV